MQLRYLDSPKSAKIRFRPVSSLILLNVCPNQQKYNLSPYLVFDRLQELRGDVDGDKDGGERGQSPGHDLHHAQQGQNRAGD